MPRAGLLGILGYDLLLIIAIAIQAWMVFAKLETWDELKAITRESQAHQGTRACSSLTVTLDRPTTAINEPCRTIPVAG